MTGTLKCFIITLLWMFIVMTHHSGLRKCSRKTSYQVLVDGHPLGHSTWTITVNCSRHEMRAQTILHAICLVIYFPQFCDEWTFSMFQVPLCYLTRFRENREKHNPYDWRTQVHRRWCARLAASSTMLRRKGREVRLSPRLSLTSIDESSFLTWSAVRSDSDTEFGQRTTSHRPCFPW